MPAFDRPLTVTKIVKPIKKKFLWLIPYNSTFEYWLVDETFRYYFDKIGSQNFVEIPKGFPTDFASVPQLFWNILPKDDIYDQPAVLHDFLYQHKMYTRAEDDEIFCDAMELVGVPRWKRAVMYGCLRAFGWWAWSHGKPADQP